MRARRDSDHKRRDGADGADDGAARTKWTTRMRQRLQLVGVRQKDAQQRGAGAPMGTKKGERGAALERQAATQQRQQLDMALLARKREGKRR
ncbi:hypothetical protein Scep_027691 [Stephania cephalantha]|uniref:Uncharacterized protein n=1 Tax=Stephania cephalantha TaxID=152367 RepID=A0AAP0E8I6_9MAGN